MSSIKAKKAFSKDIKKKGLTQEQQQGKSPEQRKVMITADPKKAKNTPFVRSSNRKCNPLFELKISREHNYNQGSASLISRTHS